MSDETMNVLDYFYSRCGQMIAPAGKLPSVWRAEVEPHLRAISIDSPCGRDCQTAIDGVAQVIDTLGLRGTLEGGILVKYLSRAVAVLVLG